MKDKLQVIQEGRFLVWRVGKRAVYRLELGVSAVFSPDEITTLLKDTLMCAEESTQEGVEDAN